MAMEASGGAASPGRQHMLAVQACGPAGRLVARRSIYYYDTDDYRTKPYHVMTRPTLRRNFSISSLMVSNGILCDMTSLLYMRYTGKSLWQ